MTTRNLVEAGFAMAMRFVPSRRRFGMCVRLANLFGTVLAFDPTFREHSRKLPLNNRQEIALDLAMTVLARRGLDVPAKVRVEASEDAVAALRSRRSVFLASPHMVMTKQVIVYMKSLGCEPAILSWRPRNELPGHVDAADIIKQSEAFLLRIRQMLKDGRLVCAMVDSIEPSRRTVTYTSVRGEFYVAPALFRIARKCGSAVVFSAGRLAPDGVIEISITKAQEPALVSEMSLSDSFAACVGRFVERAGDRHHRQLQNETAPDVAAGLSRAATLAKNR
jgi:lauroyl/myristoyl acyltransferase